MKHKFLLTLIGAFACLWLTAAQAGTPSPKFLGTWEMDMSKMDPPMPAGGDPKTTPKSITVTVKDAGGGKWANDVVIEMGDGTKQTPPSTAVSVDGTPNPVPNNPMMDNIVVTSPDPNTTVVTILKDGKPVTTQTSQLSPDGKQMLVTVDTVGQDGNPVHAVQVLNKKQ